MKALIPPPLRSGDIIGVAAPAGPIEPATLEAGIAYLEARGFRLRRGRHLDRRHGYLAGIDADRLDDLNALLADPELVAVWFARGGYGSGRIVDRIDLEPLGRAPKALIGYSDLTVLQAAAWRRHRLVTYYGPMVADLGERGQFDERSLWDTVAGDGGGIGHAVDRSKVLRPGRGEGPLIGGCLSLLVSLIGTPWDLPTDGAILFWEEVNEEPFRIDRMLGHLRQAGKLDRLRGMVVGRLVGCEPRSGGGSLSIEEILRTHLAGTDYPVILDLPAGHAGAKLTLPLGRTARLETDPARLTFPALSVSGP
jgi:muramoyltetrapeptide carboxypeptidase